VVTIYVEENNFLGSPASIFPEPLDVEKQSPAPPIQNPKKFASTYDAKKAYLIKLKSKQYDIQDGIVSVYSCF